MSSRKKGNLPPDITISITNTFIEIGYQEKYGSNTYYYWLYWVSENLFSCWPHNSLKRYKEIFVIKIWKTCNNILWCHYFLLPQDINNEYLHSKSYTGHPMLNPHSCGPIHSSYDLQLSKNAKYQVVFILTLLLFFISWHTFVWKKHN